MEKEYYLTDFLYLMEALKGHPMLQISESMEEYEQFAFWLQEEVVDQNSLIHALTKLTCLFGDGHTNIELPYTGDDLCLRMVCNWEDNKLVLQEAYEELEEGTEIIAVEGFTVAQLVAYGASVIPHENKYLVKSRMIEYPYRNYHIFSEWNLGQLFGRKSHYEIIFKRGNKIYTKQCALVNYDGFLDFQDNNFIHYEIQGTRGIFHLDSCICNDEYRQALDDFALLCQEHKVETVELDLSKNMGGSSEVINPWIEHMDVDAFRNYEMIRFSSGTAECVVSRADWQRNHKKAVLFPKHVECRVSHTTFSSARTFAVTLKDNHLANIIGQPTGGKPCSYGLPIRDATPNTKIRFRVSSCLFLRPDEDRMDEIALFPESGMCE